MIFYAAAPFGDGLLAPGDQLGLQGDQTLFVIFHDLILDRATGEAKAQALDQRR